MDRTRISASLHDRTKVLCAGGPRPIRERLWPEPHPPTSDSGQPQQPVRRTRPLPRAWLGSMGLGLLVSGDLTLRSWKKPVVAVLLAQFTTESTRKTVLGDVERLFTICEKSGVETWDQLTPDVIQHFCWAARGKQGRFSEVAQNTARIRQWSALACLEAAADMGAPIDPVTIIGARILPPPSSNSVRPLDSDEERLFLRHADSGMLGSRRSLLAALSYAGGTAPEVAGVRFCDIDLGKATVTFRGGSPRTNALGEWATQIVETWWRCLSEQPQPDELVCITKRHSVARGARSIGTQLGNILAEAKIRDRVGVSANSIRLTGALHVFEADGLEDAARFLGAASLDRTAAALRYDWRDSDA